MGILAAGRQPQASKAQSPFAQSSMPTFDTTRPLSPEDKWWPRVICVLHARIADLTDLASSQGPICDYATLCTYNGAFTRLYVAQDPASETSCDPGFA
jgi:hypothetical protein